MPTAVDNDPRHTFATFVVGSCNRFAYSACQAVTLRPGEQYNPLFIHGCAGAGKTHLAAAVGHALVERHPTSRVTRLSADEFMHDLLRAMRHDRMDAFKRRLREVDLLIVDDVQHLAGRPRTQEEFFHTFNALHDQGRQLILTSDRVPKAIPRLEERLCNRFAWGLVVEIDALDTETRIALLRREVAGGSLLPNDVVLCLAAHPTSNVRDLDALAARTRTRAALTRRRITTEVAHEVLRIVDRSGDVSLDSIARAVCEHFTLRPTELRSRRRTRRVAVPRQLAMYLCRRLTRASYPQIAEHFGRDHSTVMHANAATERRRKTDTAFHATVERLERHIQGEQG